MARRDTNGSLLGMDVPTHTKCHNLSAKGSGLALLYLSCDLRICFFKLSRSSSFAQGYSRTSIKRARIVLLGNRLSFLFLMSSKSAALALISTTTRSILLTTSLAMGVSPRSFPSASFFKSLTIGFRLRPCFLASVSSFVAALTTPEEGGLTFRMPYDSANVPKYSTSQ